jgi:alpha-L-rhamnosidase
MKITIPPNTAATVYVPAEKVADITESGQPAKGAKGVTFLRMEKDRAVFRIGPGTFRFTSKYARI